MNVVDGERYTEEPQCGETAPQRQQPIKAEDASSVTATNTRKPMRQVTIPSCISYDTFFKAMEFTYCGEVDPSSPVPQSPDKSKVYLTR